MTTTARAPRYHYNFTDEDSSNRATPSPKFEKDAKTMSSADKLSLPAQNARPRMRFLVSIILGLVGFTILLYLHIASSVFHSSALASSHATNAPQHAMPHINIPTKTKTLSEESSTSLTIYPSATFVPLHVVSNNTYYFSPQAVHMYFASYPILLSGLTTIEAASEDASHITVEAVWKTYLPSWHPKPVDIKNTTDYVSISFGEFKAGDEAYIHHYLDLTIRFPPKRHYGAWIGFESFTAQPHSRSFAVKNMTHHGITFEQINLITRGGDINVTDVTAGSLFAKTYEGCIRGHFNVPESRLKLIAYDGVVIRQ
ncbi:hypothetical protein FRC02_007991 [Tulasnella sp. 418]|nr:hypothetical protein FRC02_007991 [Tulasnella sp. 418]